MSREPRPTAVMAADDPELQMVREAMRQATEQAPRDQSGRRRYGVVHQAYPQAREVVDAGLVGRTEMFELVGMSKKEGATWYATWISHGRFPPADGQVIDGRPTWRRRTMVRFLYLAARPNGERYLIPALWPEAEAILDEDERNR